MANLLFRYEPDPADEVGRLWFELQTSSFSGRSHFWSNLSEVPGIADRLAAYPFGETIKWKWGFNDTEGTDLVFALAINEAGSGGGLEAVIEMADYDDPSQRLTAKLRPDYVSLDAFRRQLTALHGQKRGEALLSGQ